MPIFATAWTVSPMNHVMNHVNHVIHCKISKPLNWWNILRSLFNPVVQPQPRFNPVVQTYESSESNLPLGGNLLVLLHGHQSYSLSEPKLQPTHLALPHLHPLPLAPPSPPLPARLHLPPGSLLQHRVCPGHERVCPAGWHLQPAAGAPAALVGAPAEDVPGGRLPQAAGVCMHAASGCRWVHACCLRLQVVVVGAFHPSAPCCPASPPPSPAK